MLRSPAGSVGSGPVDLGRVFARERPTAVSSATAVGVDDDLPSGQTGVGVRTTGVGEASGGVDVDGGLVGQQRRWNDGANDVFDNLLADEGLLGFFGAVFGDHVLVLDGDNDVVGVHGLAVVAVHQRNLGLGIGSGPRKGAVKAEFADLSSQGLREGDGQWHPAALVLRIGFRFIAGVAEHETLVACTLVVNGLNDAAVDVSGLTGDEFGDFAQVLGGGVHADAVGRVADGSGGLASDGDVVGCLDARSEFHLTGQHDVGTVFPSFYERLHGHLGLGVEGETGINDGVGNRVAQLVGMAGSHRF